jgi:hypothetical protein
LIEALNLAQREWHENSAKLNRKLTPAEVVAAASSAEACAELEL